MSKALTRRDVPTTPQDDARELVKAIALDIGKETCAYVEVMYPDVWSSGNGGFRLSLRNHIYNEIMAALEVTDEGAIRARLEDRKIWRRKWKAQYRKIRLTKLR